MDEFDVRWTWAPRFCLGAREVHGGSHSRVAARIWDMVAHAPRIRRSRLRRFSAPLDDFCRDLQVRVFTPTIRMSLFPCSWPTWDACLPIILGTLFLRIIIHQGLEW